MIEQQVDESGSVGPEVVRVSGVSKKFTIRKDNSLKDRAVAFATHRNQRRTYQALDEISLSIRAGTTVGLLGANGSGKSTLLKLIGGILSPDSGVVEHRGRIAALLELGAGFHPDLSGRENVYLNAAILGLTRTETDERYDDIVRFSGIGEFIDNQVKFYSSGMYMRLAFAVAVHTDPDILLVDEVLAVGDEAFQRKCMDRIKQFQQEGRTIILVSHASGQVAELCDTTFVLKDGGIAYAGDVLGGLSALRDIMEGKRIGETLEEEKRAGAARAIEVIEIETLSADGAPTETFAVGDPMIIRVHVRAQDDLQEWTTGFSIDTPMGQMVLASNTARLKSKLPPIKAGRASMDYRIDSLNLGGGEYFVNANTSPKIDVDTHVLWQGARFKVRGNRANLGVVGATLSVLDRN